LQRVFEITSAIASASGQAEAAADAFTALYDAKFEFVFRLVRRKTGVDEASALDLVQETMMRVIRHIKPMRTEPELDAWLTRVAVNAAYDSLRGTRRRVVREAAHQSQRSNQNHAEIAEKMASLVELSAVVTRLRSEVRCLDADSFDLLSMRFRAGMTLEAIGRRLGVGAGAADGRLRRLLKQMQTRLEEAPCDELD